MKTVLTLVTMTMIGKPRFLLSMVGSRGTSCESSISLSVLVVLVESAAFLASLLRFFPLEAAAAAAASSGS